jgi:hypothetical protein
MKRLVPIALAAIFSGFAHAGPAIDPCVNAHENMGELRKSVASEHRKHDALIAQATPTPQFEESWFNVQKASYREWFDANLAPAVRKGKGNVETAFKKSFADWQKQTEVRAAMTAQYRQIAHEILVAPVHEKDNASVRKAQQGVNSSCTMDFGNQALRVTLGAVVFPVTVISGNIDAAKREEGFGAQIVRGVTGISLTDIRKYGPLGGPNSFFHCPFGGC